MPKNKKLIERYQLLEKDHEGLVKEAGALAEELNLGADLAPVDEEKGPAADRASRRAQGVAAAELQGNVRLLRHYLMEGVVDKPHRVDSHGQKGPRVVFGARHLFQYVTVRRYLRLNFGLNDIRKLTAARTVFLVTQLCGAPLRSKEGIERALAEAERVDLTSVGDDPPVDKPPRSGTNPILGMADLLGEIEKTRSRFGYEIDKLRHAVEDSGQWLGQIKDIMRASTEYGLRAQRDFERVMADTVNRVEQVLEGQQRMSKDIEEQLRHFSAKQEATINALENRINETTHLVKKLLVTNKGFNLDQLSERGRET